MSVAINSTRKTVEISWDPAGNGSGSAPPVGFPEHPIVLPPEGGRPEHPIYLPPYIDNSLPGDQPHPDQGLPGDQPYPDQGLPDEQPYPDQGLPGDQPEIDNELPTGDQDPDGNIPPSVQPVTNGQALAVQVFAQGQEGDWSNTAVMPNDGLAALVYPQDFTGESYVEVRGLDGSLVDSGRITIA